MKLSCPSCGAKYSIADEKVQDRLAKIRCRKCSATIIVDGKVNPPSVYTSDGGAGPAAEAADPGGGGGGAAAGPGEYSVDFGDNDQRTMTADDIAQAYRRGEVTRDTFVWADGMADWTSIGQVPELADVLAAAAPAAAAPRAAARSGSGRGSATDLFGGIATAGSEEDVTTSAPQPAMGAAAPAPTGARNESSVLFSLSALTASAPAASPSKTSASNGAGDSSDHDSGLIDLKALTSSVTANVPANPLALGTAPLGMAAPLGGITAPAISTDGPMPQPQGSKTGMYIAVALVLVGALIAGAIVMVGGKEAPAVAASAAPPEPVAAAPAPAPEEKKEEATAQPPATGTTATPEPPKEEGAKQASAPRSTPRSSGGSRAKPSGGSSSGSSTSGSSGSTSSGSTASEKPASSDTAEKPKKKKAGKTCNCAPSDLMCAMKCAAG